MATPTTPHPSASGGWNTWGADPRPLPERTRRTLGALLGVPVRPGSAPAAPLAAARVPPSALPADAAAALADAVGAAYVHTDDATRALAAGGQSYPDVVRRRAGDASDAPDAVVRPGTPGEVSAVLAVCAAGGVAVVPRGGGTSVVGGLAPVRGGHRAVVAVDLSRLDRLVALDPVSRVARFEAGIRTPALEAALEPYRLTLGHLPQSYEHATLGGYVVTRSAGQASTGVGRIDDLVVGLRMATPVGDLVLPDRASSAAGPDLRRLVLGSEGTLGIVTEVAVRVRPRAQTTRTTGLVLPSWEDGLTALRELAQGPVLPEVVRLSDVDETRVSFALQGAPAPVRRALAAYLAARSRRDGCLVVVAVEGAGKDVRRRHREVVATLRRHGGVSLGRSAGEAWRRHRFDAPYLRDALLDAGVLAETLETAATWSALPDTYRAVRAALRGALPGALVGCHVSHVYPVGASLYFTVLAAADPGAEAEQWRRAKRAATLALLAAGATVTHHHGVGTDHRDGLRGEVGDVGLAALRAVKQALDPVGICNPGKLLPG